MDLPTVGYIFENDNAIWRVIAVDNYKTTQNSRLWNVTIECLIDLSTTACDNSNERTVSNIFTITDAKTMRMTFGGGDRAFGNPPNLLRVCQLRQRLDELARGMAGCTPSEKEVKSSEG